MSFPLLIDNETVIIISMSASDLKSLLERMGMRPEDVAHETGLATSTIYRFLRGEDINRVTTRLLTEYLASKSSLSPAPSLKATGT